MFEVWRYNLLFSKYIDTKRRIPSKRAEMWLIQCASITTKHSRTYLFDKWSHNAGLFEVSIVKFPVKMWSKLVHKKRNKHCTHGTYCFCWTSGEELLCVHTNQGFLHIWGFKLKTVNKDWNQEYVINKLSQMNNLCTYSALLCFLSPLLTQIITQLFKNPQST